MTRRAFITIIVVVIALLVIAFALMITAAVLQENGVSHSIYNPIGISSFVVLIIDVIIAISNAGKMISYEVYAASKKLEERGCVSIEAPPKNKILENLTSNKFTLIDGRYYHRRRLSLTKDVINYYVRIAECDGIRKTIEKELEILDEQDYKGKNKCVIMLLYADKVSDENKSQLLNVSQAFIVPEIASNASTFDTIVPVLIDKSTSRACFVPLGKRSISVYAHGLKMMQELLK